MNKKKSRYVHVSGTVLIHCPICRGIVVKVETPEKDSKESSFEARCPHCYEAVMIAIGHNPKGELVVRVDSK